MHNIYRFTTRCQLIGEGVTNDTLICQDKPMALGGRLVVAQSRAVFVVVPKQPHTAMAQLLATALVPDVPLPAS